MSGRYRPDQFLEAVGRQGMPCLYTSFILISAKAFFQFQHGAIISRYDFDPKVRNNSDFVVEFILFWDEKVVEVQ